MICDVSTLRVAVMHRAGGKMLWSCIMSRGMLVELSKTMHKIHRILRSSTCWIEILIVGSGTSG